MSLTSVAGPSTSPSSAPSDRLSSPAEVSREGRRGDGWRAAGLYLGGLAVFLVVMRWRFPRFFYIDDKQLQYLPVFRYLGQEADGLRPPFLDPDQGMAGNFVADPQYGVLDPVHWLIHRSLLLTGDLNAASWLLSVFSLSVLGLGVCALATQYRVRPVWAAAAALGTATSGWMLFVGASWWPLTWGTALLPWLWWGLAARSRAAAAVAALTSYLLVSSGYPYALPFAVALGIAVLAERLLLEDRVRGGARELTQRLLTRSTLGPLLAAAGGALAGSANLWVVRGLTDVTQRAGMDIPPVGNVGTFVPNLLDAVLGGPTLFGQASGWWGGALLPLPVMVTAWFAVPLLALAPWRTAVRTRGVPTALALTALSALATQTTTEIGSFRFPVRYLVDLQLFLPVLTVLLLRPGLVLTRGRVLLAGSLVVGQLLLAISRTPALVGGHVLAAAAVLAGLAAVVAGERVPGRRAGSVLVAAALLLGVALLPQVTARTAVAYERVRFEDPSAGLPRLGAHDSNTWPALVSEFEQRAWQPGLDATVLAWGGAGPDLGLSSGVLLGSASLLSGTTPGFGYTSIGQRSWADRWCTDYLGQVGQCPGAEQRLLATAPGTDLTWLEVMAKDDVLLSDSTPAVIEDRLVGSGRWRVAEQRGAYTRLVRTDPMPGRATWNDDGVQSLQPVQVAAESQSYDVQVDATTAQRIVFRDVWWPGYRATLDGAEVPTSSFDGSLVQVELPPGDYTGRLAVTYRPAGLTAGLVAAGIGLVLAFAGVLLALLPAGRARRKPADEGATARTA